jgi:hypothetical protein
MKQRKDAPAIEAREKRIVGYIKQRLTAAEIGRKEGLQPDYALKVRRDVAAKHGLKIEEGIGSAMIHGLDAESLTFRSRLADELNKLLLVKRLSQLQVANQVGVPRKLQAKAMTDPYNYDWSLSEIQQLAKAFGLSFKDFMQQLLKETHHGFD